MKINNSEESAFPNKWGNGLTRREYFAAMAMQGLMANSSRASIFKNLALDATRAADALLEELEK
mgnify:CR=1 FL=1